MDIPDIAHYVRRLASFSRLISFDKQDGPFRPDLARPAPSALEEWMDDVRAVLDAVGCQRVAVMGANEGSAMAALFAATYPERVTALVLAGDWSTGVGSGSPVGADRRRARRSFDLSKPAGGRTRCTPR